MSVTVSQIARATGLDLLQELVRIPLSIRTLLRTKASMNRLSLILQGIGFGREISPLGSKKLRRTDQT
jgi:hypothetical protein